MKYIYTLFLVTLFVIGAYSQQVYNSSYRINKTDSIVLSHVLELKVPELYNGIDTPT